MRIIKSGLKTLGVLALATIFVASTVTFLVPQKSLAYITKDTCHLHTFARGTPYSHCVWDIQWILKYVDYTSPSPDPDGYFGPITYQAVRYLQSTSYGQLQVDGIVGSHTWQKLCGDVYFAGFRGGGFINPQAAQGVWWEACS